MKKNTLIQPLLNQRKYTYKRQTNNYLIAYFSFATKVLSNNNQLPYDSFITVCSQDIRNIRY